MMNDEIYSYDFESLVHALYAAAREKFDDDVVRTEMLPLELENNPGMSKDEYMEDWINDKVNEWVMEGLKLDE